MCVDKTIALPTADVMQHEADCEKASDADIHSGQAMPTEMQTCKNENDEKWPWRVQYVAAPWKQSEETVGLAEANTWALVIPYRCIKWKGSISSPRKSLGFSSRLGRKWTREVGYPKYSMHIRGIGFRTFAEGSHAHWFLILLCRLDSFVFIL